MQNETTPTDGLNSVQTKSKEASRNAAYSTSASLSDRIESIVKKSGHAELCLYRWADGGWRFMLGNASAMVMLGESEGILEFEGLSLEDVVSKAENYLQYAGAMRGKSIMNTTTETNKRIDPVTPIPPVKARVKNPSAISALNKRVSTMTLASLSFGIASCFTDGWFSVILLLSCITGGIGSLLAIFANRLSSTNVERTRP